MQLNGTLELSIESRTLHLNDLARARSCFEQGLKAPAESLHKWLNSFESLRASLLIFGFALNKYNLNRFFNHKAVKLQAIILYLVTFNRLINVLASFVIFK